MSSYPTGSPARRRRRISRPVPLATLERNLADNLNILGSSRLDADTRAWLEAGVADLRKEIAKKERVVNTTTRQQRRAEARNWAGYRSARFARSTGGLVAVLNGDEAGLDTDGGLWTTLCDDHSVAVAHQTRETAESFASAPEQWCEACQEASRE